MANLDNINDVVLMYADMYAEAFRQNAPVDTGRLRNSYRASVSIVEDKLRMQIFGEYYGPFQSFGVGPNAGALVVPDGVNPRPLNGSTYEFKKRKIGLKPQPFMQDAMAQVTPRFVEALEEAGVKDVEDFFDSLTKIEVK